MLLTPLGTAGWHAVTFKPDFSKVEEEGRAGWEAVAPLTMKEGSQILWHSLAFPLKAILRGWAGGRLRSPAGRQFTAHLHDPCLGSAGAVHAGQRVTRLGRQLGPAAAAAPRQERDAGVRGGSTGCLLLRVTLGRQSQEGLGAEGQGHSSSWVVASCCVAAGAAGLGAEGCYCPQWAVPSQLPGSAPCPWGAAVPPWGPGARRRQV